MSCLVLNPRRHSLTLVADAASGDQDRSAFEGQTQLDSCTDLDGGAAKRQAVGVRRSKPARCQGCKSPRGKVEPTASAPSHAVVMVTSLLKR